ncbi:membrane fusion protein (multidrug efflux system) [Acinetobacter calcoaceticus]|uniref:Membrane fusion protein (Multidrug efflux system) n=1 Tax=Acinetobacter calcoaceticus TaxID=471 RepID=A0A4V6NJF3_ACICA|nr:membrane fusion protein (multidrug efflux system) [Acinetobacter calcoaceticus]
MKFKLIAASILIVVLIVAYVLFNRHEAEANSQSTDDAYVKADATLVAPQIAALIEAVKVVDHQFVQAGDLLLRLDQRDLQIQLQDAEAHVQAKKAAIIAIQAQIKQQQSLVQQAKANIQIDQSNLKLASQDLQRFSRLAEDGSGTLQAKQQAEAQYGTQQGVAIRSQAALETAQQQIEVLRAETLKVEADQAIAQASVDAVRLKLSYAEVLAPISGYIDQKQARVGGYSQVGSPLLAIVPLNSIYIEANFRETQLAQIQTGQVVEIRVDALPSLSFKGKVQSVGPASGASFSPVAAANATGNFTKVVQRLPIRIALDSKQANLDKLRVGMSVKPTIQIAH